MRNVVGIGGVFFRSKNPEALAEWYETHLGINRAPKDMEAEPWTCDGGVTVFAPFSESTDYFPDDRQFMLNFRVRDLDSLLAHFRSVGVDVSREEEMEGLGRFARIHDPEGNPIELWQPEQT
ncbi:MAG: VOC family protein [Roseibium sp.]|uniref:VOC family protein n=1 Tax=Roseibium sp. TaxID=1936156 RepID=UPI00260A2C8F|nr:VOC family protein [Roseibium sp.]MCV0428630.1 VOC family protein [Roseibium sp.]